MLLVSHNFFYFEKPATAVFFVYFHTVKYMYVKFRDTNKYIINYVVRIIQRDRV